MPVTNNYGSLLVNVYAAAPIANQTGVDIGDASAKYGTRAIATTDSVGSTYRMCQVASNDIISALKISSTALTAGAVSVGLYLPNTGAVVNVNLFATAVSLAAAVTQSDVRFTNLSITTLGQRVWQLLGLASDPNINYDLVYTLTTAATAAGTLGLEYDFVK